MRKAKRNMNAIIKEGIDILKDILEKEGVQKDSVEVEMSDSLLKDPFTGLSDTTMKYVNKDRVLELVDKLQSDSSTDSIDPYLSSTRYSWGEKELKSALVQQLLFQMKTDVVTNEINYEIAGSAVFLECLDSFIDVFVDLSNMCNLYRNACKGNKEYTAYEYAGMILNIFADTFQRISTFAINAANMYYDYCYEEQEDPDDDICELYANILKKLGINPCDDCNLQDDCENCRIKDMEIEGEKESEETTKPDVSEIKGVGIKSPIIPGVTEQIDMHADDTKKVVTGFRNALLNKIMMWDDKFNLCILLLNNEEYSTLKTFIIDPRVVRPKCDEVLDKMVELYESYLEMFDGEVSFTIK